MNRTMRAYWVFVGFGELATLLYQTITGTPFLAAALICVFCLFAWTVAFLILNAAWRPTLLALRRLIDRQIGAE